MKAYHITSSKITPNTHFVGYDREKLSEFLGGDVGFAYLDPPEEWTSKLDNCWEIELPDDCPVALSLNGENIPRRDYIQLTFEEAMSGKPVYSLGEKIIYKIFVGEAAELDQFRGQKLGELCFLAKGVIFLRKYETEK